MLAVIELKKVFGCSSTASPLPDQISSESGQHQVHPRGGRSLRQTCQEEPGAAEQRKVFTLKKSVHPNHAHSICVARSQQMSICF